MKRILNTETIKYLGEKVKVCGWVNTRRDHGGIIFLDLRDRTGLLQVVCSPELVKDIKEEFVLEIEGTIQKRPLKMKNEEIKTGEIELKAEKVKILAQAAVLPFDYLSKTADLKLPTFLDYRPLMIRDPKIKAIFKVGEISTNSFKNTLRNLDFTEFQSPSIVPAVAEGGAEVFHINYYKYDAFLAQSPQLYKQIMIGAFERVFTVAHVFRAEPSVTTRHLAEYISLDAEVAFIESWEELMDICEIIMKNVFSDLKKNCSQELALYQAAVPTLTVKIPRLKMREAQKIIFERTGQDHRKEPDLTPEDEKEICQFAKEKYGSELIFITHYPIKKRPFYTLADPEDQEFTLSFDLLYQGLEIATGGQRIHQYETLVKNIKKWGNKPKDFAFYLQAFEYGLPPEGGFAFGLERIVKQVLGLKNIREATPFSRDMERIDQRLSLKKKHGKKP
ncbi:MAG: aspartate--tRNA(Asn) ligase [Candidatus Nealsonbacteria bacterium RIFCSPLOWO2_01_FULL_43_32]|uniref:Aspartate--tRNA ligase n=1 Tax=Candidatus Nealsonbacteria bacterium RIFCSPLOWO2_01_FULL_43_32 TaxID=1801672 RepID=A0A1G2EH05_9BACT|nr:MAG: aspartate--tRNA(Asn) ligase [Candidatus Nealsonbacteria bacterium RIFCSPLOWO2_01_FULL_43_32]HLC63910.1 aspartate--tRNA(Asn) ligase [Patescibacteria group bacterium]